MYWCDAAPDRIPTWEHQSIARIPETKLCFGHLTADGVQKKLDSMVLLDLTALPRQNPVPTVLIMGGDGDFVEGITTTRAFGVKVYLLGIDGPVESMSPALEMEADNHGLPGGNDLAHFFGIQSDRALRPRLSAPEILGRQSRRLRADPRTRGALLELDEAYSPAAASPRECDSPHR